MQLSIARRIQISSGRKRCVIVDSYSCEYPSAFAPQQIANRSIPIALQITNTAKPASHPLRPNRVVKLRYVSAVPSVPPNPLTATLDTHVRSNAREFGFVL